METEVKTWLFCSMSIMVEPEGPTVDPELVVATALEKVTVPKLAKGTREPFSSKSSTIHSAFSSHKAEEELRDLVTVCPVETFSMTAVPDVVEEAVTVVVMTSPALMEMPEKS